MTVKLKNTLQKALREIVAATQEGSFAYTPSEVYEKLIEHGFVEINPEIKDETGDIATRATQEGIDYASEVLNMGGLPLQSEGESEGESASQVGLIGKRADALAKETAECIAKTKASFVIEKGVPLPGKGCAFVQRRQAFPFDELEVEDSFFIRATESKPEPWKSYASTVSNATRSFAVPDSSGETIVNRKGQKVTKLVKTRKFVIRAVEETDAETGEVVVGARVWRVA